MIAAEPSAGQKRLFVGDVGHGSGGSLQFHLETAGDHPVEMKDHGKAAVIRNDRENHCMVPSERQLRQGRFQTVRRGGMRFGVAQHGDARIRQISLGNQRGKQTFAGEIFPFERKRDPGRLESAAADGRIVRDDHSAYTAEILLLAQIAPLAVSLLHIVERRFTGPFPVPKAHLPGVVAAEQTAAFHPERRLLGIVPARGDIHAEDFHPQSVGARPKISGDFVDIVEVNGTRSACRTASDCVSVDLQKIITLAGDLQLQALRNSGYGKRLLRKEVTVFPRLFPLGCDPEASGTISVCSADFRIHPLSLFSLYFRFLGTCVFFRLISFSQKCEGSM